MKKYLFFRSMECTNFDGLLICDNRIIAGHSAKKEHSKLEAVIAALFLREPRAEEMKEAIKQTGIKYGKIKF